jgi:hypothetical protein
MNSTNSSTQTSALFNKIIIVDTIVRYYGVIIHIVYAIVLIFSKELHKRTMLYVNHATLVNSFYCWMLFFYIYSDRPNFPNQTLNAFLCSLSEKAWPFSHLVRMYSILLIAIYRFLAVFKTNAYKKINNSNILLLGPLAIVWAFSIIFPLILKFSFGTSPTMNVFCLDGFSTSFSNSLFYVIIYYFILAILPTICIIVIYVAIMVKLKRIRKKVTPQANQQTRTKSNLDTKNRMRIYTTETATGSTITRKKIINNNNLNPNNQKKNRRYANQFLIMCASVVATCFALSIFSLRNVINNYLVIFFYWRPILRIYNIFVVSFVPMLSLYYHPSRVNFLKRIFSR